MSGPQTSPRSAIEFDSLFEPLLDSDEAAQLLKIHPKTLQRMARRGEIPDVQIGRLWRFRRSELNAWVEKITPRGDGGKEISAENLCIARLRLAM